MTSWREPFLDQHCCVFFFQPFFCCVLLLLITPFHPFLKESIHQADHLMIPTYAWRNFSFSVSTKRHLWENNLSEWSREQQQKLAFTQRNLSFEGFQENLVLVKHQMDGQWAVEWISLPNGLRGESFYLMNSSQLSKESNLDPGLLFGHLFN